MEDLWPAELTQVKFTPPVALLRQQASLLGQKTGNLVEAEVMPIKSNRYKIDPGKFTYGFYFRAPTLDDYRYRLFTISHDIRLYPVSLGLDGEIRAQIGVSLVEPIEPEDEAQLKEILRAVLNAEKTVKILQAILSQAADHYEGGASYEAGAGMADTSE